MTTLFGREAIVTVGTLEITSLDFSFRIERSLKADANTCELQIFGLTEDHAGELAQLAPKTGAKAKQGIPCKVEAGYHDATSLIWLGDLRTCDTVIDGPDRVTTLSSGDGEKALQHARAHFSFAKQTPVKTVFQQLFRALGISEGNLSKFLSALKINGSDNFPTGYVVSGSVRNALDMIVASSGLEWSVQDGAVQLLERGQPLAGQSVTLNSDTGLVGSPSVDNEGVLTARMLMIKDVRPGVVIVMDAEFVKGGYRVERCLYSGDSAGDDWTIEVKARKY